jgi:predicted AlkP superfamily phosphohydrolase/phosphomutase
VPGTGREVIRRRVVVIGLDGLDPILTETMMAAGFLPHLSSLREEGGYARVATTWPAQTPVAWSTFAVGANPGAHGIFDFLTRDPATYLPEIALYRHEQNSRFFPPRAVNLRGGRAVWERLSDAGIPSTILRHPCTYPPRTFKGRLLAGIGVPDLRGGFGSSTFFTSEPGVASGEGEHVVQVRMDGSGVYRGELPGPLLVLGGELGRELEFLVDEEAESVEVNCPTGSFSTSVAKGAWSPWVKVGFKHGFLQAIRGLVRFHLVGTEPLRLFASPVQFDPEGPAFPLSHPWDYAGELQRAIGPFATLGLAEEHNGLTNGRFDEAIFLNHCLDIMHERRAMMHYELERHDRGLFYCLFATPDRIQHMFWRFGEPDHPANRGEPPSPEMARVIREVYQRCDDIVGEVREYVDDDTLLMVLSDHGFSSFQREVHLNRWLHQEGYLALQAGVEPGEEAGDLLSKVDWGRTSAYALGLGGLYLNLKGREGEGWVGESEAVALKQEIATRLMGLRDRVRGCSTVRSIVPRENAYSGPYVDGAPDLLVGYEPGYRVASETAMGGVGAEVVTDNVRAWSGDHVVDPAAVPGVFFMNTPFRGESAGLSDLAPTILAALGVPGDPELEGRSLLP